MKIKIVIASALISMVFSSLSARAMELDFDRAMELARENNRTLKLLRMEQKTADLQVKEAYSAAMPVVNATGSYSQNIEIPIFRFDTPFGRFEMPQGQKHNYFGSVKLEQPLWLAGKIGIALKIAKIYRDISRLGAAQGESDLQMQVTQAFYGAILAREYHSLTIETEAQLKKHFRNVEAMFEQGLASEFDKLRAEVELANYQPQVLASSETWKTARENLRILLGLDPSEELTLAGELAESVPGEVEVETAVKSALENRADLKQLGIQKGILNQMLKLERRNQFWPSFFFTLEYQRLAQENNLEWNDYFWSDGLTAAVAVQVPLFDGFKTSSRIQQAKVNLKRHSINSKLAEEGVRLEVKTSAWKLEEAMETLIAARKAVHQAEKGYAIAEVRYANGISTQVELLDARLAETQAKIGELTARYDIIAARASLRRAMGQ